MRILITTQVFPPEIHSTARMVLELAQSLGEAGHAVTVAAGYPHHPHGTLLGGYRKRPLLRETVEGVRVIRGWHPTTPSPRIAARALVYAFQALGTFFAGLAAGPVDLVFNFGPPLAGPLLSAALARIRGARNVPAIYDIYPDIAVETGAVRNRAAIAAARLAERLSYRAADRIVVLSEGFRRVLVEEKGVTAGKVRVIPVWLDPDEIRPAADPLAWRRLHGIPEDAFVVLYAGTIGIVSGAGVMADVVRGMAGEPGILFLFVGEGKARDALAASLSGAPNARFMDFRPREELSGMLSSADVGLMTLAPGRGRTSVPSKVAGYMAAGTPVLAACDPDSDSARTIRDAGCGLVVPPGDPAAISEGIRRFRADAALRADSGRNGRDHLEEHLSRAVVTDAYRRLVEELSGRGAARGEEGS
jgi:glycosyltransferase involved in cell wall biosynthesis